MSPTLQGIENMLGDRNVMTWFMGVLLCVPIAVQAEEPSELLQHNDAATLHVSEEESPLASFLNPQQSPHPGLLGKRYFGGAYVYGRTEDGILSDTFLNDAHGFALSLNSPLIAGDGTKPVAMDVFAGYSQFFGRDNQVFMTFPVSGALDLSEFEVGVTLYTESISRLRPFVQLGWVYSRADLSLEDPFVAFEINHHDSSVLLNIGSELDLSQHFALRGMLDIDTDEFDSSTLTGELIYSPSEKVFFRMGAFTDLDSSFYGAIVGGGVKF